MQPLPRRHLCAGLSPPLGTAMPSARADLDNDVHSMKAS